MPGVHRRMLDRIGDEVARATTIVRYAPGSSFSAHTHNGGEEFIVLKGVFQDEHGDYPAGTYVRNPIGTRHIPRSDKGCTIFVKLWQFALEDQHQFSVFLDDVILQNVGEDSAVQSATLHRFGDEVVAIEEWAGGTERKIESSGGAELLLLSGSVTFEGREFTTHDWLRLPKGYSAQLIAADEGARIWIKTGHLNDAHAPFA